MLDGHDSSYYATDSDLDTVAGTIQAVSDKVGTAVLTTTAPDCSGAINELNTQLSEKIGVESVKITVPSTDNTNAYFNYPSGYSQISFVIFAIEAFNGTKFTVNPTWAQVDLYTGNGVVLFGTIPSEYKGKDLYIQYALVEE
jgi:hypothetical protein